MSNRNRGKSSFIVRFFTIVIVLLFILGVVGLAFSTDWFTNWDIFMDTDGVSIDDEQYETPADEEQDEISTDENLEHSSHYSWISILSTGGVITGGTSESEMVYYYLNDDVGLTTDITINGYVTLCLNGNTLKGTGSCSVITVGSGSLFVLCDCSEVQSGTVTGGIGFYSANSYCGGGVYMSKNSTFVMNGGIISGNSAIYGGGVYVCNNSGTFIMNGGTILDNNAERFGGGVYVSNTGTFTMNGGTISSNYTTTDNTSYGSGGGVYVGLSSFFYMNDGLISGNSATVSGSGVYVGALGKFDMSSGSFGDTISFQSTSSITISGGFLSLTAYESILDDSGDPQFIATDCMVIYIPILTYPYWVCYYGE